jgi:hypothetical protein
MATHNGNGAIVGAAACEACAHPARDELIDQLVRGIETEIVASGFGIPHSHVRENLTPGNSALKV